MRGEFWSVNLKYSLEICVIDARDCSNTFNSDLSVIRVIVPKFV